ncbi:MAG: DUF58 domain-containing protein, partial [Halobacteriaceae archaeon]
MVIAIIVTAMIMGWLFGGRSLNAVIMPGLAVLVVGFVTASRVPRPEISRRAPANATDGDTVAVKLDVDSPRPITLTLKDELDTDLSGDSHFE